jgi:murein DD-endopeptidase MepM/ murein hydrolase activator NlpD
LKSDANDTLARASHDLAEERTAKSLDQFYALRTSAMSGITEVALGFGAQRATTLSDWKVLASAPQLWPVSGRIMSSFGERTDPFNGEGAFHRGIDISGSYGQPIVAPADGVVEYAEFRNGFGRTVLIDHGHGISTLFGHLSGFTVSPGQSVSKGDVIGYVGMSGRTTGPHVHYEVHINNTPVNPYKYLRTTMAQRVELAHGD